MLHIYYRENDGEIFGWTTSPEPMVPDGLALASFDNPIVLDPPNYKYDAATHEIVEKTDTEKRDYARPTQRDLELAIFSELQRTDVFMLSDYPIDAGTRSDWIEYRRSLRGLSKLSGPAEMIKAWPQSPDNSYPVTELRERL